jgi:hypothetical protein
MFSMILQHDMRITEIATHLNEAGISYTDGKPWRFSSVNGVLRNPKYTGCNVWNRSTRKLHTAYRPLPQDQWAILPNAFRPIVDQQTFDRVNAILKKRAEGWSDERLIKDLKRLLKVKGRLSQELIDRAPNIAGMTTYYAHFGSLHHIYDLVGFNPSANVFERSDSRQKSLCLRNNLIRRLESMFPQNLDRFHFPGSARVILRFDNSIRVSLLICPSFRTKSNNPRWKIRPYYKESGYVTLLCFADLPKTGFHSFIMMRDIDKTKPYTTRPNDPWLLRGTRLNDLSELYDVTKRLSLGWAGTVLAPTRHPPSLS